MASLNIQSLQAKYFELVDLIGALNNISRSPDVICIQETWQITDPSLFPLDGYQQVILQTRAQARGGGVGIYLKNNVTFTLLTNFSIFYERLFESVLIEVTPKFGKKFIIGSVYRPGTLPPGKTFTQQFNDFTEVFTNLLSELNDKYDSVYLYGDLNLDLLKHSENKFISEYIETLFSFGFLQLVLKPTRISNMSATLIDHVISNVLTAECKTVILCNPISDHFPILHAHKTNKSNSIPKTIESRNFSEPNLMAFRTALTNYNWQHILEKDCAQEAFDRFSDNFQQIFDLYFPLTKKKLNYKFNKISPWMTRGLMISRITKIKLNQIYVRKPTFTNKSKLVIYRNLYNKTIREAKKLFYHDKLLEHKSNAKKTWQTLFHAIRRSKERKASCASLLIENTINNNPKMIAEEFNLFFTNAAADIVSKLHSSPKNPTEHIPQNPNLFSLSNVPVTPTEVIETTHKLLDNMGLLTHIIKKNY